ncbi:MAG: TetR/AcrR family transcriptional regulator [Gammaproteobacteria bacterium]|nr:MAG: TetR/AcrR family transcriptional regulator [Gammaproteobacteria bacterium]
MRKAEFDRAEVLRKAMLAFQKKGYARTSMKDLVAATGLHPGSLYCAFENKRGILLAAVEQYQADRAAQFEACIQGRDPLGGLRAYLDSVVSECACCDPNGACLVAKAINELAEQDEEVQARLSDIMTDLEVAVHDLFVRACEASPEPVEPDARLRARFFMMGIYGLRTYGHTHPGRDVLQALADELFRAVTRGLSGTEGLT